MNIKGTVIEALPDCQFKVETENGVIRAYLSGKMFKNRIRVIVGDKVEVTLSPDGMLGRIIKRL